MPELPKEAKVAASLGAAQKGELVEAGAVELVPLDAEGREIIDAGRQADIVTAREVVVVTKSYRVAGLLRRRAELSAELARVDEILAAGGVTP